ncbi:diguanylate cyclase (GGDEF) domain-containing protein [Microbulbifer donghaiensis]|uniref:diguanylate cyclase n=1 Tax=Microbulbifer donghaiensis TaxID=494016 RepID=A0A1M4ZLD6_9GAMM|nr:diguanylate cyclase [Microbulbifer donghaiensis]SHF18765.1 diguanylate cyclase (GGDEF) domain-containing protein [Microbulbifer donghaiensis]
MKYLATVIFLLPLIGLAQVPIDVGIHEDGQKLTGLAEIWHDVDGTSDLEQAREAYLRGDYRPLESAGSTGLQPGAFWSRFALRNSSGSALTLHIEYVDHQLIALDAFARELASGADFERVGRLSLADPFSAREIPHNRFVFELTLPAGETAELMVRFGSDELGVVFPSMRIWDPKALQSSSKLETGVMAFLFGGYFLMSIFALIGGITSRGKIFYIYSIYSASKVAVWSTILGYTHQYVVTDHFHWSYMSLAGAVTILCGLLFSRMFLQTRKHTPRLDYLLRFMLVNAGFLLVCALLKLTALSVISITVALLMYPLIAVVAFIRWRQGYKEAIVFALAWSLLVLGLVVQAMRDLGYVEHNFINYYWPPVASFFEMLTIMAAIGILVQRLRMLKEQAEKKYTQQLEVSKADLERQVQIRTRELEAAKTRAEQEARTDPLTGVFNRRSFFAEGGHLFKLAQRKRLPLSLLMLDIDHFKSINDIHGHATGDLALRVFSEAIVTHIRDIDVFGRIGGEEFALILSEERAGALQTAQRLQGEIARIAIESNGVSLQITASIGVAHLSDETGIEALLQKADSALYLAKRQGRNQVVEYCGMGQAASAGAIE